MILQADTILLRWFNSWTGVSPFFDGLIRFSASWFIYFVVIGIIFFVLFSFLPKARSYLKRNLEFLLFAGLSSLVARVVVTEIVRFFYHRPRPFEILGGIRQLVEHSGGNSFPSGHSAFLFAIATVVAVYYPKTSIVFFITALSIGLGRVAVGVHWPSDILGGAVVGVGTVLLIRPLFKKLWNKITA